MTIAREPYAVRLAIDYPDRLDRLTTFFRVIWIIPIAIAGVAVLFVTLTNALRIVRRRYTADRTQW